MMLQARSDVKWQGISINPMHVMRLPAQGSLVRVISAEGALPPNRLLPMPHSGCVIAASALQTRQIRNTIKFMKTLTVRLPDLPVADIEAESRGRKISKSDVVRERLELAPRRRRRRTTSLRAIADLVGSVDGLPGDLAARRPICAAPAMARNVLVDAGFVVVLPPRSAGSSFTPTPQASPIAGI